MLAKLDAFIGRVWTAILRSSLAEETVLALVSDHGINSEPALYSQAYSLVEWFGRAEGGGHHGITNRHPLTEYKIRGLNPLVSEVVTPGAGATYLNGDEQQYPTAIFDLDGNERAAVQLRSNALNVLQILLQQMSRYESIPQVRQACVNTFFVVLDAHRADWQRSIDELREEVLALDRAIHRKSETSGTETDSQRLAAHSVDWAQEERSYGEYLRAMTNLLSLRRDRFDPKQIRINDLIPKRSMGAPNGLYDLQNYVVGVSPAGPALLTSDASLLDLQRSLRHINYFPALARIRVRNNIQGGVGPAPVDFIAMPLPPESISAVLAAQGLGLGGESLTQAILLYSSDDFEALVLVRDGASGLELRYLPVDQLQGAEDGAVQFRAARWSAGFPLYLWEDPNLHVRQEDRDAWLNSWHPERDWLRAIHQTRYSNGLIGITEQFVQSPGVGPWFGEAPPNDQRLLQRVEARRRRLVTPDILIFASDHWNSNVRNFNPGGNHGSFLRISTHSVLMFAGGDQTRVPRGVQVDEPYDSLSFAATILRLVGREKADRVALPARPIDALFQP